MGMGGSGCMDGERVGGWGRVELRSGHLVEEGFRREGDVLGGVVADPFTEIIKGIAVIRWEVVEE